MHGLGLDKIYLINVMKKLIIILFLGLMSLVGYSQLSTTLYNLIITNAFTLGATEVTTTGTQLNYLNAATGTTGTTSSNLVFSTSPTFTTGITIGANPISEAMAGYLDFTSSGQDQIDGLTTLVEDTIEGGLVVPLLVDTSLVAAFTVGMGNAGDTVLFSTGDVIAAFKWDGSHNLVMTKVTGVNSVTGKDIDINLYHDVNFRDGTPTEILDGDLTITDYETGANATTFTSATIAPGQWVWVRVNEATTQPTQCIINIYGYLTN